MTEVKYEALISIAILVLAFVISMHGLALLDLDKRLHAIEESLKEEENDN